MNSQNHPALQFENVVRTFHKGKFLAVNGVSLDVQPGEVHSIIGPNGAGKTTLVKMVATILNPSSGHVFVNGVDTVKSPSGARRGLGLVIGGEPNGHAVVLTSHTMSEIEDLSSRISVIGAGRIHVSGSLADVRAHAGVSTTTTFTIGAADAKILDRLAEFSDIKSMEKSPSENSAGGHHD